MKRLLLDPDQLYDHEGNPEDGPARFIEVECGPERISPELASWVERKREERAAKDDLAAVKAKPPHHLPKIDCPRCDTAYYEIGMSNGHCAVCMVELRQRVQSSVQLEDIHP